MVKKDDIPANHARAIVEDRLLMDRVDRILQAIDRRQQTRELDIYIADQLPAGFMKVLLDSEPDQSSADCQRAFLQIRSMMALKVARAEKKQPGIFEYAEGEELMAAMKGVLQEVVFETMLSRPDPKEEAYVNGQSALIKTLARDEISTLKPVLRLILKEQRKIDPRCDKGSIYGIALEKASRDVARAQYREATGASILRDDESADTMERVKAALQEQLQDMQERNKHR